MVREPADPACEKKGNNTFKGTLSVSGGCGEHQLRTPEQHLLNLLYDHDSAGGTHITQQKDRHGLCLGKIGTLVQV